MNNKVFLSYSREDAAIANLITKTLELEGIKIWLAENEIKPGVNILETISESISACDYIIILVSSYTLKSLNQQKEINLTINQLKNRNITIIPVLIDDGIIPKELSAMTHLDIRKDLDKGIKRLVDRINNIPEIDFNNINREKFECLAIDLLSELGFQNIHVNDKSGADLEATYSITNPFGGTILEKWLFELKLYSSSRPNLKSLHQLAKYLKIEKAAKVALITNSQVTSVANEWLESSDYKDLIYIIDGTELRRLLIMNNELISKYFKGDQNAKPTY